jgi:hypothetical protein
MNPKNLRLAACLAVLVPAVLQAQLTVATETWGPQRGSREVTFSAGGASTRDFDDSVAALNLSYGYYFTDLLAGVVRQSLSYSSLGGGGDSQWNGGTRLAVDQHFSDGAFRPFIGVNFGRIYGESVRDTWAAGLEGGAKYYMQPRTFVHTTIEYGWYFDRARNANNRFNDGQWSWSMGLGFNF